MASNQKAAPRGESTGWKDASGGSYLPEPQNIPQHYAFYPILAERGREEPQHVSNNGPVLYGAKTFDKHSPYYNAATYAVQNCAKNGSACLVKRIRPANAATALVRISVEMGPSDVVVHARSLDGSVRYQTVDGEVVPVVDRTIRGSRLVHRRGVAIYPQAQRAFGKGQIIEAFRQGNVMANGVALATFTSDDDEQVVGQTRLIPLFDMEIDSFGKYGDNIGINISTPTSNDPSPIDVAVVEATRSFLYRLQCVERESENASADITPTTDASQYVNLSLKSDAISPRTQENISVQKAFIPAYQNTKDPLAPATYGPFGRVHVYENNLNQFLVALVNGYTFTTQSGDYEIEGEAAFDEQAADYGRSRDMYFGNGKNNYLLNFLTGRDYNGVNYFSFDTTQSAAFGGVSFENGATVYASGGSDGLWHYADGRSAELVNFKLFDDAARSLFKNFGQGTDKLLDIMRYPISAVHDIGYSMETKKALISILGKRPGIAIQAGPQATADTVGTTNSDNDGVLVYQDNDATGNSSTLSELLGGFRWMGINSEEVEQANGAILRSYMNLYPESNYFGTPVCRGFITGHGDVLVDGGYDRVVPYTLDVLDKINWYMGSPDGEWREGQGFDIFPNNKVSLFVNPNLAYRDTSGYNKLWDIGINWVQYCNARETYWPAQQTAYPDDTSVLNSLITMLGCCYLDRVGMIAHSRLTGRSDLTDEQFLSESNAIVTELTAGKFDNRFKIVPEAFYTEADKANGFGWHNNMHLYANNMKTKCTYTVVTHRMSELTSTGQ